MHYYANLSMEIHQNKKNREKLTFNTHQLDSNVSFFFFTDIRILYACSSLQ